MIDSNNLSKLVRDLKFIVEMIQAAASDKNREAITRYVNSAGNLLNKINQEALK